ncbi:MAG: hypothetical protein ACXAAT_11480, partial [Candidatus Hodarchaeales archaeon]
MPKSEIKFTWSRVFKRPYEQRVSQLLPTADGGYLLGGGSYENSESTIFLSWLVKTDAEGHEEWNKTYSLHQKPMNRLRSLIQTPDGGYAFGGLVFDSETARDTWDVFVVKIDENGIEQWNRTFNGVNDGPDYAGQIQVASDGGLLISGATQASPTSEWNTDFWLIKTDAIGIEEWNKTYHRIGSDQGFALVPLADNNYLIGGLSRQNYMSNSPFLVWIIKIDENGIIIWDEEYTTTSGWVGILENNLIATDDGGFLLSSYEFGDTYTIGQDYWIVKADSTGGIEWTTTFGGDYYDTPSVCVQSSAGD